MSVAHLAAFVSLCVLTTHVTAQGPNACDTVACVYNAGGCTNPNLCDPFNATSNPTGSQRQVHIKSNRQTKSIESNRSLRFSPLLSSSTSLLSLPPSLSFHPSTFLSHRVVKEEEEKTKSRFPVFQCQSPV
jgi:hypothetical protein